MKIERQFKRCPRCGFKTVRQAKVCGYCELNYEKFALATNEEGKKAVKLGERDRVVWSRKLPKDVSKKRLLLSSILFGWTGYYLFKIGKLGRAIYHFIGLLCFGACAIISLFDMNVFTENLFSILGIIWVISLALVIIDIVDIIFNRFKVPVSLPYKEEK